MQYQITESRVRAAVALRRARRIEREAAVGRWVAGEPPADLVAHRLCSTEFVSGAGWAWRVTAALAEERRSRRSMP